MTDDPRPDDDPPTPAEARLSVLLEPLRAEPPRPTPEMAPAIVRTARWQAAVRETLRNAGLLAAAAADAAKLILGLGASKGDR